MGDREFSDGFTMLDAGAMIAGAAIASIHVRQAAAGPRGWLAWSLAAILFGWVTLTAAGPFVLLVRRLGHRDEPGRTRTGDLLWMLWGIPWVASAVATSLLGSTAATPGRPDPIHVGSLGLGLFLATMIGVPILAARYLWDDRAATERRGRRWTERVGLGLTSTWPIQCGVGLVLIG